MNSKMTKKIIKTIKWFETLLLLEHVHRFIPFPPGVFKPPNLKVCCCPQETYLYKRRVFLTRFICHLQQQDEKIREHYATSNSHLESERMDRSTLIHQESFLKPVQWTSEQSQNTKQSCWHTHFTHLLVITNVIKKRQDGRRGGGVMGCVLINLEFETWQSQIRQRLAHTEVTNCCAVNLTPSVCWEIWEGYRRRPSWSSEDFSQVIRGDCSAEHTATEESSVVVMNICMTLTFISQGQRAHLLICLEKEFMRKEQRGSFSEGDEWGRMWIKRSV